MVSPTTRLADFRSFFFAERLVLYFNLLDAVFTALYLMAGVATEANPLLAAAWEIHPGLFVLVKTALVATGLVVLHRCRTASMAQFGIAGAVLTYGAVVAWHLAHVSYL